MGYENKIYNNAKWGFSWNLVNDPKIPPTTDISEVIHSTSKQ